MDEAVQSRAPLLVTRQGGQGDVVILAAEEFEAWQEAMRLLSSRRNAERLMRSIQERDAGGEAVRPDRTPIAE